MTNIKKIIKSSFAIILALIMLFSVGCRKDPEGSYDITPRPEDRGSITLNITNTSMYVGDDNVKLNAIPNPVVIGQSLIWQSSNPEVVMVDSQGNLEAINEGNAKIIVSYGEISAECNVSVSYEANEVPSLVIPFEENSTFNVAKENTYRFEPKVRYRGRTYSDVVFTYEIENTDVVELDDEDNNTIIAKANGISNITIKGSWRNKNFENTPNMSTTVAIKVVDDVIVKIDGQNTDSINVYTRNEFAGQTFENVVDCSPVVFVNGDKQEGATVNVEVENEDLVKYENAKLEGVSYGTTSIVLEYEHVGETIVKQYIVNVLRPQVKFARKANFFSSQKGTLRDETNDYADLTLAQFIYGEDTSEVITDATVNGQELTVSENKVLGLAGANDSTYTATVSVGTATEVYEVDMVVYGVYLYSLEDLDVFVRGDNDKEMNCYVELARDLDANGITLRKHFLDGSTSKPTISNGTTQAKGFRGTFDGKGHTISNLTTGDYGLMCATYEATIKNVAFVDVVIDGGGFLAESVRSTTVENVYIKVASMAKYSGGSNVLARFPLYSGFFKNIYVNAEDVKKADGVLQGSFAATQYKNDVGNSNSAQVPAFENCFVLSELPLGVNTSTDGNYPWAQLAIAESTNSKATEKKEMMEFIWNNLAFKGCRDNFTDSFLKANPGAEVNSDVLVAQKKINVLSGVMAYKNHDHAKEDASLSKFFDGFTLYEYWGLIDGILIWGEAELNAEEGQIYLNVGKVAGQMVMGMSTNVLTPTIGDTVKLPNNLECYGYKFIGWKEYKTGVAIVPVNGEYIVSNYDGSAMEYVAMWEIDSGVSTGPEIGL